MPTLSRFAALSPAPVLQETLELLEWPRLCAHLASFASTQPGRREAKATALPDDLEASRQWLARSIELAGLDGVTEGGLSFQGVHDLDAVLKRCSKGGVADGEELLEVADTLAAARRLRRQIVDPDLRPLCTELFNAVVRRVGAASQVLPRRAAGWLTEPARLGGPAFAVAVRCNGATVCRMS